MPVTLRVGNTFLFPFDASKEHLWIVMKTILDGSILRSVIVSVSTFRGPHCDTSAMLAAGCHPFVTRDSFIAYGYARLEEHAALEDMLSTDHLHADASGELMETIYAGFKVSDHVPRGIKKKLFT